VKGQISNGYYYFYYFKFILIYYLPGGGLLVSPIFNKTQEHFILSLKESYVQRSYLCPSVVLGLSDELGATEVSGLIHF